MSLLPAPGREILMHMALKNASTMPKRYFGLHMVPGVAEYRNPMLNNGEPFRILVEEEAIKNMDPTFEGKPVYVMHVDEVNVDNLQNEADGYVLKSFYNPADGKHWCEFLVVSDKGHEAISKKWKLSNAYHIRDASGGGEWHAVSYQKKVLRGEYEHMAIVPNPRYGESIILTPEEFKAYNAEKEIELKRLSNSKDKKGESSMFNFFKKSKVENSSELAETLVTLPKSKREGSVEKFLNEVDSMSMTGAYANGDHKVKVGEEEMTVNELVEKHMEMKNKMDSADKDAKAANEEKGDKDAEKKPENEEKGDKEADKKPENESKAAEEKKAAELQDKAKNQSHFDKLKNAPSKPVKVLTVETSSEAVARGKSRYGSN